MKEVDPETHKEYIFEKFKEGHTGKNYVSDEDVFKNLESSKPKFKKKVKIDVLKWNVDVSRSKDYLESRAILRGKGPYYCEDFNQVHWESE